MPRRLVLAAGPPVAGAAGVVVLWWAATWLGDIEVYLLPSPPDVVSAFLAVPSYLVHQTLITLAEVLEGFAASAVVGIGIGIGIAAFRPVERTIYPLLTGVNAVPKLAIAPLLVIWLGFGELSKVVMVFLICFFPIVMSTATGLMSTPPELLELAHALDAPRFRTFARIRFPGALREIFVGLKVAITLAVIGAVISEFVGAGAGLGFVIQQASGSANTPLAFASLALLALLSIVLFYLLTGLERVLPWTRATARR